MKLSEIIQRKQTKLLHIMESSVDRSSVVVGCSINDALSVIAETVNSAVLVVELDGKPAGILTEKDIIEAINAEGVAVLSKDVDTIMTSDVEIAESGLDCETALNKMVEGNFRNMPVFENDDFKGIMQVLEVAEGKMSEVLEENRKLKELAQSILPDGYIFHENDDAKGSQLKMNLNQFPYALVLKENGLSVIINSTDFLFPGTKSHV